MTNKHKVLFLTDRGARHQQDALEAAPPELTVTMLRRPPIEEVLLYLPETEFLISERAGEIGADLIAAGEELRLVQRLGSLTFDIDLEAARAAGVPVSAWPVRGAILVAEHMVLQMLALAKRLNEVTNVANRADDWGQPSRRTDEDTFAYNWSGRRGIRRLHGSTVGILGFGEIGAELTRRLRGFGPAQILYYKRSRLPERAEADLGLTYASLTELVAASDVLCVLLPYAPETDLLISSDLMARLKPGAFLIGCGSGSVIDEAALAEAVLKGHLSGVALDTFEWEPLRPDNPLLALARDPERNVLLTPHTAAGSGDDSRSEPWRRADYENIVRVLGKEPILHRVA